MKPSDFTVIRNGLDMVLKAFIKRNQAEINYAWRNSSLKQISSSLVNSTEEKLSSTIALSSNPKIIAETVKETIERGSMVTEGIKQYVAISLKQNKTMPKSDYNHEYDTEYPLLNENEELNIKKTQNVNDIEPINPNLAKSQEEKVTILQDLNEASSSNTEAQAVNVKISLDNAQEDIASTSKTVSSSPISVTEEFIQKHSIQLKPKPPKSHNFKLSDLARERKVPSSRLGRSVSYGGLFVKVGVSAAADAVTERAKTIFGFKSVKENDENSFLSQHSFLSEANVNRIVDTLCQVRGAALKLGQMLSIQDNSMVNPQLAAAFERVRQSADFMPIWQMEKVLIKELGENWREKFSEFNDKPFAAASIGQVHCAKLLDGSDVALKIQYPGVAEGIESDIKNLMSIVNLWNIFPKGAYIENAVAVAKRELKREVDYLNEAKAGLKFKQLLKDYPEYYVPQVYEDLSTSNVLTTELVYGVPVDKLQGSNQDTRNKVCERLLRLCLMEIFLFEFMQTDPNWSNFLYNADTDQIILLDFGACNSYEPDFVNTYMGVIKAAADQDRDNVLEFSRKLGFLSGYEDKVMNEAHVDAVMILGEAFACDDIFNFTEQNMTKRIHKLIPIMLNNRIQPPPEETYSLHRKMSGIFLLCTKLEAKINCRLLFDDIYSKYLIK